MYKVGDIIKKGFTLIEILAVVTIIGLLFILVIPKITNSLNSKKEDIDNTTNKLIISATKQYINNNIDDFDKEKDNVYCMPLTTLVKENYLDKVMDKDNKDITNIKSVKITYDKDFKYEIVNKNECKAVYNEPLIDSEGNKYKQVEYLESTGTQYIDTGYKPNGDTKVELKYQTPTQNTTQQGLFGARDSGDNRFTVFTGINKNAFQVDYSVIEHRLANYAYNISGVNGTAINVIKLSNSFIINGNQIGEVEKVTFQNSLTMFLFANNNNGKAQLPMTGYLWYFKIYDNNSLVRDYIPVIDSSSHLCLFDKVENKCYYNQGTGEFLYG